MTRGRQGGHRPASYVIKRLRRTVTRALKDLNLDYKEYVMRRGDSGIDYNFEIVVVIDGREVAVDVAAGREDDILAHLAAFTIATADCGIGGVLVVDRPLHSLDNTRLQVKIVNMDSPENSTYKLLTAIFQALSWSIYEARVYI